MQVTHVQPAADTSSNNGGGSKRRTQTRRPTWPLGAGPSRQLALDSQQIAGLTMTKNTDFTVAQKGNQTIDQ